MKRIGMAAMVLTVLSVLCVAGSAHAQLVTTYYAPTTTFYAPTLAPNTSASVVTGTPMPTTVTAYYPAPVTTYYAPATVVEPVTTYYAPTTTFYAPAPVAAPVTTYYAPATAVYTPVVALRPTTKIPGQPIRNLFRWP